MSSQPWNQGDTDYLSKESIDSEIQKQLNDLATKVTRVPVHKAKALATQLNCWSEIAPVLYILKIEHDINAKTIWELIFNEFKRKKSINEEIPDISTFRFSFGIGEATWAYYLTIVFPERLKKRLSKLQTLEGGIWGNLKGEPEDAALWLIERQIIAANYISPVVNRWKEDHKRTTTLDAIAQLSAGFLRKSIHDINTDLENARQALFEKATVINNILADLEPSAWIDRAQEEIKQFNSLSQTDLSTLSDKLLFQIALEISLDMLHNTYMEKTSVIKEGIEKKKDTRVSAIDELERQISRSLKDSNPQTVYSTIHRATRQAYLKLIAFDRTSPFDTALRISSETLRRFDEHHMRDSRVLMDMINGYIRKQGYDASRTSRIILDNLLVTFMTDLFFNHIYNKE